MTPRDTFCESDVPDNLPALVPVGGAISPFADLVDQAKGYAQASRAASTLRAYRADWAHFAAWCARRALAPIPATPGAVALYLVEYAGSLSIPTLGRRLVAISRQHRLAGHHLDLRVPAFRETWQGVRRTHGRAPEQKAALTLPDLRSALAAMACPAGAPAAQALRLTRDRAICLIGFSSAARRSELSALEIADLAFSAEGVRLTIRRSKTDQEGAGAELGIPCGTGETCAVTALRAWLEAAAITEGPVFRPILPDGVVAAERLSGRSIAATVKRAVGRVGLNPAEFAGHSLRAGFATSAAAAGANLLDIMQQTRHRSQVVAAGYVRRGSIFRNRAVAALGL